MHFLDGSPELTALVIVLARGWRERPISLETARDEARRFSGPSPRGLSRTRYDRLFLDGLVRCGYLEWVEAGLTLKLTRRSLGFFEAYEKRELRALRALVAEAGIAAEESSETVEPPAPAGRESVFSVTRSLLEEVLQEAGLPEALMDEVAASYRTGKVYLSEDGGRYRFVLSTHGEYEAAT
ncbi:MAG TPA: hypothetical protein VGR00_10745 [Thermoanaerobaculia bacterium]|nr:hypothetical protein [Thermoanaerobaculia bacterium]